ncbi:hypothetical protein [Phycisphaera mikurensis]|uniref:Uncharacterized protein n=1 Tax=Phycisphaera mikurensis (strain NBRC 102666 / KCTC 22515 / FYK2301M01) TaxID=1142394 RepID=I0IB81_PHYMF|nr:hypothetical protein [Phycisphaera mikurensis]MBB6443017.1 hypothetical protein [Phycisphaera mikurensis]BAM02519.1 hypothetical protein PSMK_03600 [Phycisphaera mikurensis NBRC 102666]
MESPPPPPPRDAAIPRLHERLDALQAQQRSARLFLLGLALLLILIVLLFGFGLYRAVTTNLSVDKLQPALMERVEARAPQLQRTATEALTLAMPTYQRLGSAKIEQITPALREGLQREFDALPEAVRERLDERLAGMRSRLEQTLRARVTERFGEIPPDKVERLAGAFSDRLLERGGPLRADLEAKYELQKRRVEDVLTKFDLPATAGLSDGELQLKVMENAALLVVYLAQNPDELPVMPTLGDLTGPDGAALRDGTEAGETTLPGSDES